MSSITASAYDLHDFDRMFADEARTRPYLNAIASTVRPGDVVVEIGTGTGYFAVACVRAGARHVYAIEVNPAVAIGPAVAAANGCADRITFVHGFSTRLTLPERGDVLLEDLRGALPLLWGRVPSIVDARERLLKPDARLITVRDDLFVAPCRLPQGVSPLLGLDAGNAHGIARDPVEVRLRNDLYRARITPGDLLAPPVQWGRLDYASIVRGDVDGRGEWTLECDGAFDGFALWFECELAGGQWIRNTPGAPQTVYGQAFLPLARSRRVTTGDRVAVELRARLMGESYLYAWDTTITPRDGGHAAETMRQSTLAATLPLSFAALERRAPSHRPVAGASARLTAEILALADGARSLDAVAAVVAERYASRFSSVADALNYCTALLAGLEDEDAALPPEAR